MNGTKIIKKNPKVTIITVSYNAEDYIEKTIKSVLEQSYKNIEYIIVDGKSKDSTVNIIKKYEKYIDYWISEPDNGIYDAMNKAIKQATGKWINFMNAGDTFYKRQTVSNIFLNYDLDKAKVIYGSTMLVKDSKEHLKQNKPLSSLLKADMPFVHQSVFVKSKTMKKYLFSTKYKLASDYELFLKLYLKKEIFLELNNEIISKFLLGGIHSYNMNLYTTEALNSLFMYYPKPRKLIEKGFIYEALYREDIRKNISFSNSLSNIYKQVKDINETYNNVVIFGYGTIGKLLEKFLTIKIVAIVDKQYKNDSYFININELNNYSYETIIITPLGREKEIVAQLEKENILNRKCFNINI